MKDLKLNHVHYMKHKPSGEEWYIVGIRIDEKEVCAAGWPPSIAKMEDMEVIQLNVQPLTDNAMKHRKKQFGTNWK